MIGEGEQGRVYEAVRLDPSTNLRQTVAVKILRSKNAVDLWRKEFSSLAEVRSPYCVRVLSFERVRGRPALILEHVRGLSLTEWHRAQLGGEAARTEILAQIHGGLRDLRLQSLYHGDLSPNNVMVDDRGGIRLLDFGLANGHGAELRCTPEFAAPERLRGAPPDYAADLFSLGQLQIFLGGPRSDQLLAQDPAARTAPPLIPDADRAAELSRLVNGYLVGQGRGPKWVTQTLQRNSDSIVMRTTAALSALVMLSLPASPSVGRPGFGALSISTSAWHQFKLDGQPLGYAPLVVPVTSDRAHRLEWTNVNGTGARAVDVRAGERRRLTDRDFSH